MRYRGRTLGFSLDDDSTLASLQAAWSDQSGRLYELSLHHATIGAAQTPPGNNIVSTQPVSLDMAEARVTLPFAHFKLDATGYGGPGNVLNPTGLNPTLGRDPDGLSPITGGTSRTPTGLLYPIPFKVPEMKQSESEPDWWYSGWVEAGFLGTFGQDTKSAMLNEYGDWRTGGG